MLNIVLIPLALIITGIIIYIAYNKKKKGKANYRDPDDPEKK